MSKELIERLKNEGDGVMSRREKTLLAGYIEELEKERDQLRKDVEMLREVVNDALSGMGGGYAIWSPRAQEALAATEQK